MSDAAAHLAASGSTCSHAYQMVAGIIPNFRKRCVSGFSALFCNFDVFGIRYIMTYVQHHKAGTLGEDESSWLAWSQLRAPKTMLPM